MRFRVKLSDQQITQLTSIMDNTRTRYHDVKARWDRQSKDAMRPELKAIQADSIQQIKGILSESQRIEYDKLRADREKRHQANKAKAAAGGAQRSSKVRLRELTFSARRFAHRFRPVQSTLDPVSAPHSSIEH